jgi:prevent-host-death family protein
MKIVSSSEFRSNASAVLDLVENGEVVRILRHGKPVAEMVPFAGEQVTPAWKRPGVRLAAAGASLSKAVLAERRSSR